MALHACERQCISLTREDKLAQRAEVRAQPDQVVESDVVEEADLSVRIQLLEPLQTDVSQNILCRRVACRFAL